MRSGTGSMSSSGRGPGTCSDSNQARRHSPLATVHQAYTSLVYGSCMARIRTNIEIDEDSVLTIMDRYGVRTKTEAVDLALRHLAGQPMSREEALAMRGAHAMVEVVADAGPRP